MKYVGLLSGCLILIASSALSAMAQRTGAVVPQLVVEPIKVTSLSIDTRKQSGKSWTTQPIIQIENTSTKTIEYLTIETMLPGMADAFMLAYGQAPGKPATNKVALLQPGAKITLSVAHHACDLIRKRLLEIDSRTLARRHATARINGVVFNDQTAWFDGLPHVMEPHNPQRWQVVRSNAGLVDVDNSPVFGFLRVGYKESNPIPSRSQQCWDRLGTEWVDCCGLQQASAIMVQVFGGVFEPIPMSTECCEWIKQGGCF